MYLARHETPAGPRWALDGQFLPIGFTLDLALQVPRASLEAFLRALPRGEAAAGPLLAPVEPGHDPRQDQGADAAHPGRGRHALPALRW